MTETTNFSFKLIDFDKIPWHEDEHDNWHLADALLARYVSISNVQGVWQNALAVTVGQRYIDADSDTIWEVLVAHTTSSTLTFSADRTANSTYWQTVSVDVAYKGAWTAGTVYSINDFVTDSARYGVVAVAHTSVTSYDQGVSDGNIITLIDGTTLIAATHVANVIAAGGTPTATYDTATGKFTFGLVTGNTGATGATGADYTDDLELNAISGLTSAANKAILFTGSGTAELIDLTAFAKTFLDDANAAAVRATIGAIGAATSDTLTNKTFDANGTGNSLNNVDVADLAIGTDGELITWDAAGAPATVAVGTATHVLTSNGAGTAPTFQAAGGGDVVLLQTETIGGAVGSIDFDQFDNATYTSYFVVCSGVTVTTNNDDMYLRTSSNGGSTFDSGGSDYTTQNILATATYVIAVEITEGRIEVDTHNIGNAANKGTSGIWEIRNPVDTEYTYVGYTFGVIYGSGTTGWQSGEGVRKSAADVDAVQVGVVTGTMDAGTFKLYGRK